LKLFSRNYSAYSVSSAVPAIEFDLSCRCIVNIGTTHAVLTSVLAPNLRLLAKESTILKITKKTYSQPGLLFTHVFYVMLFF